MTKTSPLEDIVEAKSLSPDLEDQDIYMPQHHNILDYARDNWHSFTHAITGTALKATRATPVGSLGYMLWRIPAPIHNILNKTLDYTTYALTRLNPPAGIYSGLTSAVSKTLYGIKTKSGKSILTGISGALTHLKKLDSKLFDTEKTKGFRGLKNSRSQVFQKFYNETHQVLEKYLWPFNKDLAKAAN